MLLHLNTAGSALLREAAGVEQRLLQLCIANLDCFEARARALCLGFRVRVRQLQLCVANLDCF